jgi:hypothetical protein
MVIPSWALSVLGLIAIVVIAIISYFLSKSLNKIDNLEKENHSQNLDISTLKVKQEDYEKNNVKEFKQLSDLLIEIKVILQDHAVTLNHMDKNSAVTAEALKRMMKIEDELSELSKKNQEMEIKLEVLIKTKNNND